mmetsp:Transcript_34480/g.107080  ORF Transcript_34480/g.107080 Transcript_34480/m.107080 type:complete len:218 (+) Transcript_34480:484-1137(+)
MWPVPGAEAGRGSRLSLGLGGWRRPGWLGCSPRRARLALPTGAAGPGLAPGRAAAPTGRAAGGRPAGRALCAGGGRSAGPRRAGPEGGDPHADGPAAGGSAEHCPRRGACGRPAAAAGARSARGLRAGLARAAQRRLRRARGRPVQALRLLPYRRLHERPVVPVLPLVRARGTEAPPARETRGPAGRGQGPRGSGLKARWCSKPRPSRLRVSAGRYS